MPSQDHPTKSPARRPPNPGRTSSTLSISRENNTSGTAGTGGTTGVPKYIGPKQHKAHATRHFGPRVPSHGKGLNKLAKAGVVPAAVVLEELAKAGRHHRRSASHTPSTSPSGLDAKRNVSAISLSRAGPRASFRRNMSQPNLSRNASGTTLKMAAAKMEKTPVKKLLGRGTRTAADADTDDHPAAFGGAHFEIGDEQHDSEWTEDSTSQSPVTTRSNSRPKTPVTPSSRVPTSMQSPISTRGPEDSETSETSHFSHPPDAQAVTRRLLSHHGGSNLLPQTSRVSANVTPHHVGSPRWSSQSQSQSQSSIALVLPEESSMPADGISRFISAAGTSSGSGTPGSMTRLQQNLVDIDRTKSEAQQQGTRSKRTKSALHLSHKRQTSEGNALAEEATQQKVEGKGSTAIGATAEPTIPWRPSPFESARSADPLAGKSYTLLKLNLDREASSRAPPLTSHPLLLNNGSTLSQAGTISLNATDLTKRIKIQYTQARKDILASRRYYPCLFIDRFPDTMVRAYRAERSHPTTGAARDRRGRARDGNPRLTAGTSSLGRNGAGSPKQTDATKAGPGGVALQEQKAASVKGRVRFEVGGQGEGGGMGAASSTHSRQGSGIDDPDPDPDAADGLEALLRRMWLATDVVESGGQD